MVAADAALPLAIEVDASSGAVRRVLTWPVSPELREFEDSQLDRFRSELQYADAGGRLATTGVVWV